MLVATVGFTTAASADVLNANLGINATVTAPHVQVRGESDDHISDRGDMMRNWGVFGTVTAVNGSTITVQTKAMMKGNTSIPAATYTVTTSSSTTVDKNNATSSVSAIAVGDTVMVEGTMNGTTITASRIHDGLMMKGPGTGNSTSTSANFPAGNGQPVIGGTVSAVNGNTITITNQSNASYTIDVTNAKITKGNATSTAGNIAVGDNLIAQGTINGNTVTAVNVIDSSVTANTNNGEHRGFFGSIGSFFAHLFGFGK